LQGKDMIRKGEMFEGARNGQDADEYLVMPS